MKRLLLVGAGHAHLEILRRQILEPLPVELTVASVGAVHHYSGMVPGYLRGTYREAQIAVRVPDLVARAGGRFVEGRATGLDPETRTVRFEELNLPYDLVSFAVGSNTAGDPGAAERIKPLERVVALRRRLLGLAQEGGRVEAVLVGGGAAGVEMALAIGGALPGARITIVESGDRLLGGYPERFLKRASRILQERGIVVRLRSRVAAVRPEEVELEGGERLPSRLTVWLTGAVAWPLFQDSGLPVDERGFLWLDDSLRSVADPRVFAAGDCGTLASRPATPKAGVIAVREAPVLWESLKAALAGGETGGEPPRYTPQKRFLSILNTADGRALLDYKGLVSHSRWAWRLKDGIDRRFMARYQELITGV